MAPRYDDSVKQFQYQLDPSLERGVYFHARESRTQNRRQSMRLYECHGNEEQVHEITSCYGSLFMYEMEGSCPLEVRRVKGILERKVAAHIQNT